MTTSCFVNVTQELIKALEENTILKSPKMPLSFDTSQKKGETGCLS